jgi:transcriptional regulator with XRE-family HTH domain
MVRSRDRLGEALFAARTIRASLGDEIRDARLDAGLSQRVAAAAVGISHSQFGRIERGELRELTVEQLSRACGAVGLKLVARAYPVGEPVRDAAQIALLSRFRRLLPPGVGLETEVPLPIPGDLRAWDGLATFPDGAVAVDAESRLRDAQALDRRMGLKQRDGAVDRVILLVNDTAWNRRVMRAARDALRGRFPADGRELLRAIRAGHAPGRSGILVL